MNAHDIDITGEDGRLICSGRLADRPHTRLRGLMGRKSLAAGSGLLIKPAPSIHTFFMRFAIDAVFLDRDLRVVGIHSGLPPWRIAGRRGARAVLELPAGTAQHRGVRAGEQLHAGRAGESR